MEETTQSEFGKGLVICLVKFAEHAERWRGEEGQRQQMHKINPELFTESHDVEMFFNGASDHLYEIEVPKKWEGTEIGSKVKELQDFGLMIGHGFTKRTHKKEDLVKAYGLCREIALLIDKKIGLKPELGQW